MPEAKRRHPDTVEVKVLPGKHAVVHRVRYPEGRVLTVHKSIAQQLIKDGVAAAHSG